MNIDLGPEAVGRCIDEVGFGFMFAPRHHAAMAHVVPVRKELGVRTIFNFLGPLTNPAGAERQLLGVSDRHYQETIAEALVGLGTRAGDGGRGRGRRRRALDLGADPGDRGRRAAAPSEWFVEPGEFGLAEAELGGGRRRHAGGERRRDPRRPGRRGRARAATSSCSTPAAAIYVGGLAADLGEGVDQGCRGDRLGRRPPGCSTV